MVRTVLIVEENRTEQRTLAQLLENDYEVHFATDIGEMMSVVRECAKVLAAIIIDLTSPDNAGFEALQNIRENAYSTQIPIIVLTESSDEDSQVRAMSLGANGYVSKPVNGKLLLYTLENSIALREKSALVNAFRKDALTGLLSRTAFFETAEAMIKQKEPGYYILSCLDIENFKVINDQYGFEIGDQVLKHVADLLTRGVVRMNGLCCRYSADKFGILFPAKEKDSSELIEIHEKMVQSAETGRRIRIRIGRYWVNNLLVPVSAMFDRATLAEESIRGRYDVCIAEYTDSMRANLLSEQQVVNEMKGALEKGEFEPWFQPQYNHSTGALIGAEALVRWCRDDRFISPNEFIPVFERNGFIYEMDQNIWEQVCRILRKWLDEGREILPVSVNISRRDLYHQRFMEVFTNIVKKYDIPYHLLRLEVTESAFAEASGQIIAKVNHLIEMGFTVEIDDFGSGYSSLNTLKDVPASILKLDMKFFENTKNQQRGGNIVESIVRMAKWIGMAVIAEGVEHKEQADFLKSIGCFYIQGYYYAKPMPLSQYENLLENRDKESKLTRLETLKTLDNSEFWNPKSMETLIFNSYVGGACIFEYQNGETELLRVNDRYAEELGQLLPQDCQFDDYSMVPFLDEENKSRMIQNLQNAINFKTESSCELILTGRPKELSQIEYIRTTVRMIARADERYLFYCVIENMTEQREAEKKQVESSQRLEVIMSSINGGVAALQIDEDGSSRFIFNNDKYYELYGYTRAEAIEEKLDVMASIVPEDFPRVMEQVKKLKSDGIPATINYRITKKDGSPAYLRINASLLNMGSYGAVITSVVTDVTEIRELEDQLSTVLNHAGNGITALALRESASEFLFINEKYFEIVGYSREEYARVTKEDMFAPVHPEDREALRRKVLGLNKRQGSETVEYRLIRGDEKSVWLKSTITITRLAGIDVPVQIGVFSDITAEKEAKEQLQFLNDSAHDILAQPDSEIAVNRTLEKLMHYFAGDRAYVIELDYAKEVVNNTYERCAAGVTSEIDKLKNVPFEVSGYWFDILRKDQAVVINDVSRIGDSRADLRELLSEQDIHSLIVAPLWRDGILVGYVGIDNPAKATDQLDRLKALGDYIAILLTRRDLSAKINSDQTMMNALMNDTPGGFVRMRWEPSGEFVPVYSNEGFMKLVGMNHEELQRIYEKDVLKGVHPEDRAIVQEAGEKMLANGEAESARFRVRNGRGDYIWLTMYGRVAKDPSGGTYLNVYYSDASKQMNEEQKQKDLLDNLPCGAALYEYDGKNLSVIHINKRYWELVDRKSKNYADESFFDVIHPDDRTIVYQEVEAAIRQNRNIEVNLHILSGKSGYRPFHIDAKIAPEKNGKYLFFASYRPISDEPMSLQEMIPMALSTMMSSSEDMSYVLDKDLHYICCSRSNARMLGLESEREVIGKTDYDLFNEELAKKLRTEDRKVLETGKPLIDHLEQIATHDGRVHVVCSSIYPIMDSSGTAVGLYGISRDITAQREKESQLELLTDSIPGGLASYCITDDGIRMSYFNDGFYKFSGYSREEYGRIVEEDPLAFVFDEDKPRIRAMIRGFRTEKTDGHVNSCIYRCHTKDKGYRWMSLKTVLAKIDENRYMVNVVQLDITEQQEEKERIRVSEELNRLAIEHSGNIITRFDVATRTLTLPESFDPIFVLPHVLNNMPKEQIELGRVSPDTADIYTELFEGIVRGQATGTATYQQNSTKGWRWLEAQYTTVFSDAGKPVSAVISFADVTEELEKEVVYNKWQQSLEERPEDSYTLFRCNLTKGATFDSWEGKLLNVNFDDETLTFDEKTTEYMGQCVYEDDRQRYLAFLNSDTLLAEYYRGRRSHSLEYREMTGDGSVRWLRLTVDLVEYPGSKDVEVYLMYENIDEQKKADLLTLERSEKDPLTGTLNRAAFSSRMERILLDSKPGENHALFMLDVDNFKKVNDSLGHGAGDQILLNLTERIRAILRRDDLIGRMGGDEFIVFLKSIPNKAAAEAKAGRICELDIGIQGVLKVSVSVGAAMIPENGSVFDELYKTADEALYQAKKNGKAGYFFAKQGKSE